MHDESTPVDVRVGDLTFDALAAGPSDGTAVLLLHGFPQTSHSWRHQIAALADAGLRAVAFDQRGYSPRARPSNDDAYRLEHLVGDVLGVADALGMERFHVVGHDWGGFVAWQLAARHPQRLHSVVSVSTPHPRAFGRAIRHLDQRRRSAYMPVLRARYTGRLLGVRGALGLRALFAASGLPPSRAQTYIDKARNDPSWLPAALAWYRVNTVQLIRGRGDITVPTMYVWSTDDTALGPHAPYWTGEFVAAPYRFEVLPGVSHWIPEMAADTLNRLLLDHVTT